MVSVKLVCAAALLSLALAAQNDNGKNGDNQQGKNAVANANAKGGANANNSANNGAAAAAASANADKNGQNANADNKNNNGQNANAKNNGQNANANKNNGQNANADNKNNGQNANADNKNNGQNANANNNNANANNNNNANADNANNNNNSANANNNNNNNNNNNQDVADSTQLSPQALQTGSESDGTQALGSEAGQAASQTSKNNFINGCVGQTLTNGLQITTGSCNGIIMGKIPAKTNMISSIITFPQEGQEIQEGQDFNITLQVNGLDAGSFTNAVATYYAAPQDLNKDGNVIGHTHVTVQDLGNSLNPAQPPDPQQFAFFKGINDAGNGKGGLAAAVAGGLPAGNFRVCTLTSASNHQPVIMPVAQRGSQDDCTKFVVKANGNNKGQANEAASNGAKGQQAQQQAQQAAAGGAQNGQNANAQGQNANNKNGQNANAQGQDANNKNGQNANAQGQNANNKNGQNANAQGQNANNKNGQNANAQGQNANNKNGQAQQQGKNKAARRARFTRREYVVA